ncbi:MAG: sensor histidine kinase, partial [Peptostreptococcaceae bacterium]
SKESKDKNQGNLNIIRQNCYRLLRIVNNIIDIAKVDSGFMNLQLKNIEIVSLIESLVLSIVPYAKSKNLEVLFDTQEEEIVMSVDPNKIERIILNLLSNAIKFSKKHGQILCNINKENDTLVISIKDNGIGIDKENLDKIFEKFAQVEDTFIRKNEGSGIGLALVKSFVDLHGGSIEVDSKVNEGSIFTIKLPIQLLEGESIHICDLDCMQEDSMSTSIEFSDIYT